MTDLWALTIAFRPANTSLRLLFNAERPAKEAYEALSRTPSAEEERGLASPSGSDVEISDSYGSTATVDRNDIMARWLTCLGDDAEGKKAEGLLVARAQASFARQQASDPILQMGQGGAIDLTARRTQ